MNAQTRELLEVLRELRFVDEGVLSQRVERLGSRITPELLIAELVQANQLSSYQGQQFLEGNGRKLILGSYRLIEPLGEGGMGHVFKASQVRLNRFVAIKVIAPHLIGDEQALQRFQREAQAAALLTHPNIVVIHDFDCDGPTWYLVMEFVEGTDLAQLVKQRGTLGVREACVYIRQAAEGLQHAHEAGLIHRDVKPHNLLLTHPKEVASKRSSSGSISLASLLRTPAQQRSSLVRDPEESLIKILDLGLARFHVGAGMATLTQSNALLGTPDFISPEQSRDPHSVDGRADIYSLGCTFYYLLAGQAPFADRSIVDKLVAHQSEYPTPIEHIRPQVPAPVADIVRKMIQKSRRQRFATAREVSQAIENYLRGGSPAHSPQPLPEAIPEPKRDAETPSITKSPVMPTVAGKVPVFVSEDVAKDSIHRPTIPSTGPEAVTRLKRTETNDPQSPVASLAPGKTVRLQGHRGPITGLAFSSDGRLLASCATDDQIRIWNLNEATPTELVCGSGSDFRAVQSLTFAPGNLQVAIGTSDLSGRTTLWNWGRDERQNTILLQSAESAGVSGLSYSPDGAMLAVGVGSIVEVWRIQDEKARIRASLKGHRGGVRAVAFSPTIEGTLASGGEDGTVRLWQLGRLWAGEKAAAVAHRGSVEDISWSEDGAFLATGGLDQKVRIWEPIMAPNSPARSVGRMDVVVRRVQWFGNGFIGMGDRGQVVWWERLADPSSVRAWNPPVGLTTNYAISRMGMIAVGCSNGNIHLMTLDIPSVAS